jgi:hypothetical protein
MPKRFMLCLTCVVLLISALNAQEEKPSQKILKNSDILLMTQNHFDDETLIEVIEVSETDFDVSSDALVDMMRLGVRPGVLRAMLRSAHKKQAAGSAPSSPDVATTPPAASPAPTAPPDTPESAPPARTSDVGFATRTAATTSAVTNAAPSAPSAPLRMASAPSGMYAPPNGMMGVNPQLAAVQAQLASMGMGGLMGNMGMGGMGGMGNMGAMNYSPEQLPHVFLRLHHGMQEITANMAQIGQSKFKGSMGAGGMALRSLATEGLSFAAMGAGPAGMMAMSAFSMVSGFMPGMRPGVPTATYAWGLPGRNSSRELGETNPMFELTYGDIPGVDPDAYEPAVLKLFQTKDNYRLVGATQVKMTAKNMRAGSGPENGKWLSEERWPTHVYKEERGFYILRVDSALEPGEYAVVLRPVKGYKASPSGLGGHAQVFYSVWDFSVPGEVPEDGMKKKEKY